MMPVSKSKELDIAIVGAGTLGTALAYALHRSGYRVSEIVARDQPQSLRNARAVANRVHASATTLSKAQLNARITWICVPDDSISDVAQGIAKQRDWRRKIVLHSSGALCADALAAAKQAGAETASAHPLMTFVNHSSVDFSGVPFALEGDPKALAVIGAVVGRLGGKAFRIAAQFKPAYHAFGFFSSPALVALITAAQQVGKIAGLSERQARDLMEPIVRQTIDNCFLSTPQEAFSGPLRRGDLATVRKHLDALKQQPNVHELYRALVHIALQHLPVGNADEMKKLIGP
jgi:predicted short-subunit dehydrogenase-like oxidoreductase (DUF2520 family)